MMFARSFFDVPGLADEPEQPLAAHDGRLKPGDGPSGPGRDDGHVPPVQSGNHPPDRDTEVYPPARAGRHIVLEPGDAGLLELGEVKSPALRADGTGRPRAGRACVNVADLTARGPSACIARPPSDRARGLAGAHLVARACREPAHRRCPRPRSACSGQLDADPPRAVRAAEGRSGRLDGRARAHRLGRSPALRPRSCLDRSPRGTARARGSSARSRARISRRATVAAQGSHRRATGALGGVLVAAALFGQTLTTLRRIDPGFEQEHILVASMSPAGYPPEHRRVLHRACSRTSRIPGVVSAAQADHEPLDVNTGWNFRSGAAGRRHPKPSLHPLPSSHTTISGHWAFPVVRGRDFTPVTRRRRRTR